MKFRRLCVILLFGTVLTVFLNLGTGYTALSLADFTGSTANATIAELRINRVLAMFLVGISMPTSGFLLQEYFQNPLAGPSVLGISSVASLCVAFYMFLSSDFGWHELLQNGFISLSAIAGSLLMMLVLIGLTRRFHDKSFLIIFGFLVSALAGAVVSVLQLYADNQSLKNYVLWSFGAGSTVTRQQVVILGGLVILGIGGAFQCIKPLIGHSLGVAYASSLGVDLQRLKLFIILSSSLLSAAVTAFLGPILFIGIVVPHFSRMLYRPSQLWHQWILNLILGVLVMEVFSVASEHTHFPLNVITSLFGIPVILAMLMKKRTL
ncbi:iron ABC transporter permease [Bergeyella sp. RCAD1439]|uniref:iron ABC transporter permease n=1 Tax=Bergeyella anatis TaxID=3113737 RepID=UPI002E16EF98|nr:iron ABC transporter permease [Bergeyella sp. RCAD1439]